MRNFIYLISILLVVSACSRPSKKAWNTEKFLNAFREAGKEKLTQIHGIDTDVQGEVLIEGDDFAWINIGIQYAENREEYALLLNREAYTGIDMEPGLYMLLDSLLDVPFVIYWGNMHKIPDVTMDDSPDFLLSATNLREEGRTRERIMILDEHGNVVGYGPVAETKTLADMNVKISESFEFDTASEGGPVVIVKGSQEHIYYPRILNAHYRLRYQWNTDYGRFYFLSDYSDYMLADGRLNHRILYQVDDSYLSLLKMDETHTYNYLELYTLLYILQECLNEPEEWDLNVLLERISGIPVINHSLTVQRTDLMDADVFEDFQNINPEFIHWASENMIPNPEQKELNGFFFQYLYDRLFRYGTRTMAAAYLYLTYDYDFEEEMSNYTHAVMGDYDRVYTDLYSYLDDRYSDFSAVNYGMEEVEYVDYGYYNQHISFWLRRGLDGSQAALWDALTKILELYDSEWFEQYAKPPVSIIQISEADYYSAINIAPASSVQKYHSRLNKVIVHDEGIDVNTDNGEVVSFKEKTSDDGDYTHYFVAGYLIPHDMVIIQYFEQNMRNSIFIRLSDGYQLKLADCKFNPSGNYIYERDDSYEYTYISISSFDGKEVNKLWSRRDYFTEVFWFSDTELFAKKELEDKTEYYRLEVLK